MDSMDIMKDIIFNRNSQNYNLEKKEKFDLLKKEKVVDVYHYLENILKNLNIEILSNEAEYLFPLMLKGKLEGWCWQTTETAALFMPDDAIVYRGDLYFNKYDIYYHGFIKFKYENEYYVFDPCLCLINKADLYFEIFDVNVKGSTTAYEIKKYFLDYISNPPKKDNVTNPAVTSFDKFLKEFCSKEFLDRKKKEIVIYGKENPSHPMYRNGSGYNDIVIENNKVKSLTVHYYMNG